MGDSSLFVPPPPPNPWPLRIVIGVVVLLLAGALAFQQLRYYPERKQVERFLDALVAADYPGAYQIWGPTTDYTYQDFLQDWGETTPRGRLRSYEIVSVGPPPREVLVRGSGTLRVGGGRREWSSLPASMGPRKKSNSGWKARTRLFPSRPFRSPGSAAIPPA
jgi:hypothetical protein